MEPLLNPNRTSSEILRDAVEFLENSPPIKQVYIKCCAMGEYYCGECGDYGRAFCDSSKIEHTESCKYYCLLAELRAWIWVLENKK